MKYFATFEKGLIWALFQAYHPQNKIFWALFTKFCVLWRILPQILLGLKKVSHQVMYIEILIYDKIIPNASNLENKEVRHALFAYCLNQTTFIFDTRHWFDDIQNKHIIIGKGVIQYSSMQWADISGKGSIQRGSPTPWSSR